MNRIPLAPIDFIAVGDLLTGQDGNKYVVCDEGGILYWKPVATTKVTQVPVNVSAPSKPIKKVKEVKEKYYWKDNDNKPVYDGDKWTEMRKSLKPKVSPNKFPAGYVWTTKFSNISYIVETGYKGYSTTMSKFWDWVPSCPPCLDANDYPFEYVDESENYYVDYDEQGNKFWSSAYCTDESLPLQQPYKFIVETARTVSDGSTYVSVRCDDGSYNWDYVPQDDCDSDDE